MPVVNVRRRGVGTPDLRAEGVPRLAPGAFMGLGNIREGGLLEHRSERQAPRRTERTIIPTAIAEPPCERSVFGEPARRPSAQRKLKTCPHSERSVFGEPSGNATTGS